MLFNKLWHKILDKYSKGFKSLTIKIYQYHEDSLNGANFNRNWNSSSAEAKVVGENDGKKEPLEHVTGQTMRLVTVQCVCTPSSELYASWMATTASSSWNSFRSSFQSLHNLCRITYIFSPWMVLFHSNWGPSYFLYEQQNFALLSENIDPVAFTNQCEKPEEFEVRERDGRRIECPWH